MKARHNEISSQTPATEDLILRGKNIVIEGEGGTLPLTGAPLVVPSATAFASIDPADITFSGGTPPTITSASLEACAYGEIVHVLFAITCSVEGVNNTGFSVLKIGGANPLGLAFAPVNQYYVHGGGNVSSNAFTEYDYFPAQLGLQFGPDFRMRGSFQAPINAKIIRGEFTYRRV